MSRPQRKTLTSVTIGPYRPSSLLTAGGVAENLAPPVTVGLANLYDPRMGALNERGRPVCDGDHAACFGRMGQIPLTSYMLNPAMEEPMLQYLKLFQYQADGSGHSWLEMREGVYNYVQKHRTLIGFRKLKAIAAEIATSNWRIWAEGGGVRYVIKDRSGNTQPINISGTELRNLLIDATRRYSDRQNTNVTLEDVGINTEISKPEDFVIGSIPVLPNTMRIPSSSYAGGEPHPYSNYYAQIIQANQTGRIEDVRTAYLNLINKGESHTLKSDVFTSHKKAFVRGSMFAKVGGQIARSVVTPNPDLRPDEVGIPRHLARDVSQRVVVTEENLQEVISLIEQGHVNYIFHMPTREYIRIDKIDSLQGNRLEPGRTLVLRELRDGDFVLVNRQPTLHKNSILGFIVRLHDGDTIQIHPSASTSFGADFDGIVSIAVNSRLLNEVQHLSSRKTVQMLFRKKIQPASERVCQKRACNIPQLRGNPRKLQLRDDYWKQQESSLSAKVVRSYKTMCQYRCNLGDIYIIWHIETERVYIGQVAHFVKRRDKMIPKGIHVRVRDHFQFALNGGVKSKDHPKLYNAIRKYGRDAFDYDLLETCDMSIINERECYWIQLFDAVNDGYNITHGGQDRRPYDVDALAQKVTDLWKDKGYRDMQVSKRQRKYDLPYGITPTFNSHKEISGYSVQIIRNGKKYSKAFGTFICGKDSTLEQRLEIALKYRDEVLASYGETA